MRCVSSRNISDLSFLRRPVSPGQSVPASDAVDQAWHLHLAYTRDYWDIMCATILPQALHHGPTAGGDQERDRYAVQYQNTLDRYQGVFGPVPADIWPDSETRFAGAWQRIDRQRHLIISKTKASFLALIPASMLAVACSPQTFIAELSGMSDLEKGVGIGVGILLVSSFWVIGRAANGKGGDGPGGTGSSGCSSGCGGCSG